MSTAGLRSTTPAVGRLSALPWATAVLVLPALGAAVWPALAAALQYERGAVAAGEAWRLVTGHWTHWSTNHLFLDLLAFAGLGAFCELRSRWRFLVCLGLAAPAIGLGVHLLQPHLTTYRGLSGLDSALYVLAAGAILEEGRRRRRGLVVAGAGLALGIFAAKVLYELSAGAAVFVRAENLDVVVVPLAHLLGALGALPLFHGELHHES